MAQNKIEIKRIRRNKERAQRELDAENELLRQTQNEFLNAQRAAQDRGAQN